MDTKPRECWRKAFTIFSYRSSAIYVEGWAIREDGVICEHAWIELDGHVLETTDDTYRAYYPGVSFTWSEVRKRIDVNQRKLPLARYAYTDAERRAYVRAYDEALADAEGSDE